MNSFTLHRRTDESSLVATLADARAKWSGAPQKGASEESGYATRGTPISRLHSGDRSWTAESLSGPWGCSKSVGGRERGGVRGRACPNQIFRIGLLIQPHCGFRRTVPCLATFLTGTHHKTVRSSSRAPCPGRTGSRSAPPWAAHRRRSRSPSRSPRGPLVDRHV